MAEPGPSLTLLIKLLKMTTSSHEHEALVAMRKANAELVKFGGDWEALLKGKVTVIGDPFADLTKPDKGRTDPPRAAAPPPPQPQPPPRQAPHPFVSQPPRQQRAKPATQAPRAAQAATPKKPAAWSNKPQNVPLDDLL